MMGANGSPTNPKSARCAPRPFALNSDLRDSSILNPCHSRQFLGFDGIVVDRMSHSPSRTITDSPHHHLFSLSTRAFTMAMMASPKKGSLAETETEVKKSFIDGLKSISSCVFSFAPGEVARGRDLFPGSDLVRYCLNDLIFKSSPGLHRLWWPQGRRRKA